MKSLGEPKSYNPFKVFQSDFTTRHRAFGAAKLLLSVLDAREIHIPTEVRARIVWCGDEDLLRRWGRLAATAGSTDLFVERFAQTLPAWHEQSDFASLHQARGEASGKVRGMGEMLLVVLEGRGFSVSEGLQEQILECEDEEEVKGWGRRAVTADKVEDIFD